MKYLRKFQNQTAYNTAKSGSNFWVPCVSLIDDIKTIAFDNIIPTPVCPSDEIWYTTTDGEPIELSGGGSGSGSGSGSGGGWPEHTNTYEGGKGIIKFTEDLTEIPESGFVDIENLETIVLPNGVTSIGSGAFWYCAGLTSVTIPNSVTSIGYQAFYYCTGLTSVIIPNSVTSIEDWAFGYCTSLASVTISNGVTSIGEGAFYSCASLTSVTIPNSVTSIANDAFYYCTGLTSLSVEAGNTKYDSRNNCNAIIETSTNTLICGCQNTTIPNSVTSIGEEAFGGCSGLTSVTIPNSVTSIGTNAFANCSGLTSVTIGNGVTILGNPAMPFEDRIFDFSNNLTTINYTGTIAQWNAINKGSGWNETGIMGDKIPATVVHCTDGDVNIR